ARDRRENRLPAHAADVHGIRDPAGRSAQPDQGRARSRPQGGAATHTESAASACAAATAEAGDVGGAAVAFIYFSELMSASSCHPEEARRRRISGCSDARL